MRIPPDAFEFYASLGPNRSYARVAKQFGVSKRSVTKCARREEWARRLSEIEHKARAKTDQKLVESVEQTPPCVRVVAASPLRVAASILRGGRGAEPPVPWGSRAKPALGWLERSAAVRGRSPREEGVQGEETHNLWTTRSTSSRRSPARHRPSWCRAGTRRWLAGLHLAPRARSLVNDRVVRGESLHADDPGGVEEDRCRTRKDSRPG
jgi:hypothetical protein